MSALNPRILRDTHELIRLYKTNPTFRERFDLAVKRNVNVTYKNRPIKLYFEILANSNRKYKNDYLKIRRIIRHDQKDLISKLLLRVTAKDLENLNVQAKHAESDINATTYTAEEIAKRNYIEETSATPVQRRQAYTDMLDRQRWVAKAPQVAPQAEPTVSSPTTENKESPPPSGSPSSTQPDLPHHTISEKAPSVTTPTIHTPTHDLADDRRWATRINNFFRGKTTSKTVERVGISTITEGTTGGIIRTISTRAGARFAAGRVAAVSAGKIATKLGLGAVTKAGVGILAKLGFSAVTGIATGGIGLVVGIVLTIITTFGKQIMQLGKMLVKVTIGVACAIALMLVWKKGEIMNALNPPYDVAYAEPAPSINPSITPSTSPSPSISPTPGMDTASCPLQTHSTISCGSLGSIYDSSCPGGHCSPSYGYCDPNERARLIHSIDVPADANTSVYLPSIDGKATTWIYGGSNTFPDEGRVGGNRIYFTSTVGTDSWQLYLTHVNVLPNISLGGEYQSGSPVAVVAVNQVHVNIKKNADWLDPESLKMCTN